MFYDATPDPDDDDEPDVPQEVIDLTERLREAEMDLAKIGLHLQHSQPVPVQTSMTSIKPGLVITCDVGDLAFTKRVQDPQAYADEQAFTSTEAQLESDAFLDERERIKRTGTFFGDGEVE